ncbi:hypothetical protein ACFWN2_06675 [Lentzea sp. NPDC058436]|uniref:hypothetical protein n=1 Tax=Lentzea sp. NPDC058436 TaxID=3346499 RepID=UPI0036552EC3
MRLREKSGEGLVADFSELVALDEWLTGRSGAVRAEAMGYEAEALAEKLRDADREGVGVTVTSSALTLLDGLASRRADWQQNQAALDAERFALGEARNTAAIEAKAKGGLARALEEGVCR